jgi:CPA1 family monovalent cation:H+ antiporter
LDEWSTGQLIWFGLAVSAAAILVRVAWVMLAMAPRVNSPVMKFDDARLARKTPPVIGWAGPRGVVTLATALALPLTTDAGAPFPHRDLVIFLAFAVILATLVGQGLTLPLLIRRLDFPKDDSAERELALALREMTSSAVRRLDELSLEEWTPKATLASLRTGLAERLARVSEREEDQSPQNDDPVVQRLIMEDILRVQRKTIRDLHDRGEISIQTARKIEGELDAMEARAVR